MANPVVTDASGQVNGASLVLGFQITLTDAQIKALPTTPVQIVAAPGGSLRVRVVAASFALRASAGAYTNINTTYATCTLTHTDASGDYLVSGPTNDGTLGQPLTAFSTMFGSAANTIVNLPGGNIFTADGGAQSGSFGYVGSHLTGAFDAVVNLPVFLAMDNNGSGNLTGGNVANRLIVSIYYALEALAAD